MLNNITHVTVESRPIERRGRKRATPIIERSSSIDETILYLLLSIQELIGDSNGFWRTSTYNDKVENILTSNSHLMVQVNYRKRNRQH